MKNKMNIDSYCVKESKRNTSTKPHILPIYATSSFSFDDVESSIDIFTGKTKGHVYSRYGNPTIDTVAQKLADLEGYGTGLNTFGLLTSSGMSAISTLVSGLLNKGDKILTQGNLYGGTTELFKSIISNFGIETIFIDMRDKELTQETIKVNPDIKLIYLETPANPTLACVDLEWISSLAKSSGIITAIDNTFCTPIIQQPLAYGIDLVIHSTTKYLNGHGNSIAGVIIGHREYHEKSIWNALKLMGATCNPFDAWLINNGLKTLSLRVNKHSQNASTIARHLEQSPKVTLVNHTSLPSHPDHEIAKKQMSLHGGMLSFAIDGNQATTLKVINALQFCTQAPTLGDVDTLVLHPATSSHLKVDKAMCETYGITENLVRLSVGIEDVNDIIEDLDQALSQV